MRLFLLSLLAIGSVHSLTIGYPYRSALLGYSPARGEFPVQSSVVQGYLRYLDSNGVERLVGYSYPEPVLGVRQLSYVSGVPDVSTPVFTTYRPEESSDFTKAREAHFRAYSLQQYQALKREVDALRAAGKEPSNDLLAKFQPLERIALTSDYSTIAELPDVKRVRDEHLTLFNDARIQDLQMDAAQTPIGEIKTYTGHNAPLVPVEETPEQKLARQEHLRIYREQLSRVQQLQEQERNGNVPLVSTTPQSLIAEQPLNRLANQAAADGLTEVERATQEHLRLWNEAKLRAEQASQEQKLDDLPKSEGKAYEQNVKTQVVSDFQKEQTIQQIVEEARTVSQKAHENHLRLVNEATAKIQSVEGHSVPAKAAVYSEQPQVSQLRFATPAEQSEVPQIVSDTPEVVKAREEHLRLVNEARIRAQNVEQAELEHKHVVQVPLLKAHQPQITVSIPQAIPDSAEVIKAREEHLRLVHEAQLRSHTVEQQSRSVGQQAEYHPVVSTQEQVHIQPQIADTPEVLKAREEHLRLVNEAKLKAKSVEHQSQALPQQQPKNNLPEETPEVIQAREEHLRIFQAVKAHAEKEKANSQLISEKVQSRSQLSPEEADKIIENEEQRILELERIREAERLQEDQKQLEMERIREAERLAEEQRQMEAELERLKKEEYDRLLYELLVERRSLRADLEKTKQEETLIVEGEKPQLQNVANDGQVIANTIPKSSLFDGQVIQQALQYVDNPFLRSITVEGPIAQPQVQPPQQQEQQQQAIVYYPVSQSQSESVQSLASDGRYIQSSQQSIGSKHQHLKENTFKIPSTDNVSYQPADTAAALIHLEKARQEHFRAHEQALEQLRLARVQNPSLKDCNH